MRENLDRINVRRLAPIERNEDAVPFDAETEILPADIAEMQEALRNYDAIEETEEFIRLAALLKQLAGIQTRVAAEKIPNLHARLEELRDGHGFFSILLTATYARELGLVFVINDWQEFRDIVNERRSSSVLPLRMLELLKELGMPDLPLRESDRVEAARQLMNVRQSASPLSYQIFTQDAAWMKVLGILEPGAITDDDWQKMRTFLATLRSRFQDADSKTAKNLVAKDFFQQAVNMKIIAAESVECTEHGLVIGKPAPFPREHAEKLPPVPESSHLP